MVHVLAEIGRLNDPGGTVQGHLDIPPLRHDFGFAVRARGDRRIGVEHARTVVGASRGSARPRDLQCIACAPGGPGRRCDHADAIGQGDDRDDAAHRPRCCIIDMQRHFALHGRAGNRTKQEPFGLEVDTEPRFPPNFARHVDTRHVLADVTPVRRWLQIRNRNGRQRVRQHSGGGHFAK